MENVVESWFGCTEVWYCVLGGDVCGKCVESWIGCTEVWYSVLGGDLCGKCCRELDSLY